MRKEVKFVVTWLISLFIGFAFVLLTVIVLPVVLRIVALLSTSDQHGFCPPCAISTAIAVAYG